MIEVLGLLLIVVIGVAALLDGDGDIGNAFSTFDRPTATTWPTGPRPAPRWRSTR